MACEGNSNHQLAPLAFAGGAFIAECPSSVDGGLLSIVSYNRASPFAFMLIKQRKIAIFTNPITSSRMFAVISMGESVSENSRYLV